MEKLLEVENLCVSYHSYAGEVQAVRGISFFVGKGETVAIVGESGCGESVTAKTIMGLTQATGGEIKEGSKILYEGEDITKYSEEQLRKYRGEKCSIIFQDALASLNPIINIGNQLADKFMIHQKLSKKEALKEAVKMLELVGITNPERRIRQYPHEFSGE